MKKFICCAFAVASILFSTASYAKNYKGAEYRTKESYLYGRFEANFKVAGKEGTLGTMFTYFDGSPTDTWGTSKWNEIDIEILGRYTNDVQYNTITPGQVNHVRHQYVDFNPALDYHTYAIEWTPDYVAWFIDGTEFYRQSGSFVASLIHKQKLMFNTWIPNYSNWIGMWNEQVLPAFTYYDWAAYYAYTPGSGNYGTNNNFKLSWKDDFNSFDSNRWEKATHTWDGNNCDFVPENAVFQDGKLILCLTFPTELGYMDKRAPAIISARAVNEKQVNVFWSEEVDKTAAENSSLYILNGIPPVKDATLLEDNRTVKLDVENLNLSSLPVLIVKGGIKDRSSGANVTVTTAKSLVASPQLEFPLKINVGGNAALDYISDKEFVTDTSNYGFMEGSKGGPFNSPIANTEDDIVFQSEVNGLAKYAVRIPNGTYSIKLLFAENYFMQSNQRIFDVYIQGIKAIAAFDPYREAGSRAAVVKTIDNVEVKNNLLDVHFAALVERPLLNGIVIEQIATDVEEHSGVPNDFKLYQNYPNPFNPDTVIRYKLNRAGHVSLKIYDLLGRELKTLVDEFKQPGSYSSRLSLSSFNWSSGIYFCRLTAGSKAEVKKMTFMK